MIKSQFLRDLAARVLMWLLALRDLAAQALPRLRVLGDLAARALLRLRALRDLAVQTLPRLRALRDLAVQTLLRLRDLAVRALLRLRALRDLAVQTLLRLRDLAARALPWLRALRDLAARALPWLRALRDLAARTLLRLRDLAIRALLRLRDLAARALLRLRVLGDLAARTLLRLRDLAARALLRLRVLGDLAVRTLLQLRALTPAPAVVLTAVVTSTFLMFVLTEPAQRWLLLLGVVAAALGTDGVLRSSHPRTYALGLDTTPQIVLPALYALAMPLFIEENVRGLWTLVCVLIAGLGFGAILIAEVRSVRDFERGAGEARIVADAGAYLTAFALLSLIYTRDPGLAATVAAAALVGGLLSVEVLRYSSVGALDMLTFTLVGALVLGELGWALHFVPLDGHLAAVALLLAFFFTSGVLSARLRHQLTREVLIQYGATATLGVAVVVAARAADLA